MVTDMPLPLVGTVHMWRILLPCLTHHTIKHTIHHSSTTISNRITYKKPHGTPIRLT